MGWSGPQNTTEIFKIYPDQVVWRVCSRSTHTQTWNTQRRSNMQTPTRSEEKSFLRAQFCTEQRCPLRDYLQRYFCRWCRFLLLVCSGRPVFSSSPRLRARLWPNIGWRWSLLRGSHRRRSYTCCDRDKKRRRVLAETASLQMNYEGVRSEIVDPEHY